MVLICISLMISDIEHLFMCLLVILMSFGENPLFSSYAHFLIKVFLVLLLSFVCSLYIWDIDTLPNVRLTKIISLLHFVDYFFCCAGAFEFHVIPLVDFFSFVLLAFQKIIAETNINEFLPYIFFYKFVHCLIHLELIFVSDVR